jgi:hypothetical protein
MESVGLLIWSKDTFKSTARKWNNRMDSYCWEQLPATGHNIINIIDDLNDVISEVDNMRKCTLQ